MHRTIKSILVTVGVYCISLFVITLPFAVLNLQGDALDTFMGLFMFLVLPVICWFVVRRFVVPVPKVQLWKLAP